MESLSTRARSARCSGEYVTLGARSPLKLFVVFALTFPPARAKKNSKSTPADEAIDTTKAATSKAATAQRIVYGAIAYARAAALMMDEGFPVSQKKKRLTLTVCVAGLLSSLKSAAKLKTCVKL